MLRSDHEAELAAGGPAYVAYPGQAGGNVAAIAARGWVGGLAAGGPRRASAPAEF